MYKNQKIVGLHLIIMSGVSRNTDIIPGKEYIQYNQYLGDWYSNRYTTTDTSTDIRSEYLALLEDLKLYFTEEEKTWLQNIDFNNDLDIEDAIPFFVKKLKEIGIYFINKREAIKKSKLKWPLGKITNICIHIKIMKLMNFVHPLIQNSHNPIM